MFSICSNKKKKKVPSIQIMSWNLTEISPTGWILPLDGSLRLSFRFYLGLGRDSGVPEGFRMPVLVVLRAMPVIESEVPSRLIIPGVPGVPAPLDPEAVRPLILKWMKIKKNLKTQGEKKSILIGPAADR